MKKQIATTAAPAAVGPYSQAILAGDTLYVSGQIPLDPATGLIVEGGVEAQAIRVMENTKAVLAAAGLDFADVVKTGVFLADMNDFACVNEIYGRYFTEPYPARACVQVSKLPKGALIEMECIAHQAGCKS